GGAPEHRVVALTPQGRQLTQPVVEELADEPRLTLLSARFEGFDERIVQHLASDAISIGPYVLSGGELPAMVLVDAIARRLPGALAEGSAEHESFSTELERGLEYPHYTRPPEFRGWNVPEVLLSEYHGWNPLVRLGVPQPWRGIIDWIVTIVGAIAIVLAIKAWVVNPYRIPSSSMEPTLHCGSGGSGCLARFSDRVLANRFIYHFRDPHRGEIVVFNVPSAAITACGSGGVFVKRIVGVPGDVWQERQGRIFINGKRLNEPYIEKD